MRPCCLQVVVLVTVLGLPLVSLSSSFSAANIGMLPGAAPTQAYVSEVDDLNDFWWNPAGLGHLQRIEVAGGYMDYLASLKGAMAGVGGPVGHDWAYNFYLSYLSTGQIDRTDFDDPTGGRGETFTFGELVGGLSAGVNLHEAVSAGAGLKFAREQLDGDFKTGVLADLGASFRVYAGSAWPRGGRAAYISAVAKNLLVAQDAEGSESPASLETGVSIAAKGMTAYSGGLSFFVGRRGVREVRAGMVAALSDDFRARLGYRRRVGENSDSSAGYSWIRGLTAGFGVRFGRVWVDYIYEDASPLDAIHRFGLTFAGAASR